MFTLIYNFYKYIKKKSEKKLTLVVVGLDNAGKTTLLNTLQGQLQVDTSPTFGFNSVTINRGKFILDFFDLGGGKNIRSVWKRYLAEVHGLIFVLDAADPARFDEARLALEDVLEGLYALNKPLLVYANKQDLPTAAASADVVSSLGLVSLKNNSYNVIPCTAKTSLGSEVDSRIQVGLHWLTSNIESNFPALGPRVVQEAKAYQDLEAQKKKEREERVKKQREERLRRQKEAEEAEEAQRQAMEEGGGGGGIGIGAEKVGPNPAKNQVAAEPNVSTPLVSSSLSLSHAALHSDISHATHVAVTTNAAVSKTSPLLPNLSKVSNKISAALDVTEDGNEDVGGRPTVPRSLPLGVSSSLPSPSPSSFLADGSALSSSLPKDSKPSIPLLGYGASHSASDGVEAGGRVGGGMGGVRGREGRGDSLEGGSGGGGGGGGGGSIRVSSSSSPNPTPPLNRPPSAHRTLGSNLDLFAGTNAASEVQPLIAVQVPVGVPMTISVPNQIVSPKSTGAEDSPIAFTDLGSQFSPVNYRRDDLAFTTAKSTENGGVIGSQGVEGPLASGSITHSNVAAISNGNGNINPSGIASVNNLLPPLPPPTTTPLEGNRRSNGSVVGLHGGGIISGSDFLGGGSYSAKGAGGGEAGAGDVVARESSSMA